MLEVKNCTSPSGKCLKSSMGYRPQLNRRGARHYWARNGSGSRRLAYVRLAGKTGYDGDGRAEILSRRGTFSTLQPMRVPPRPVLGFPVSAGNSGVAHHDVLRTDAERAAQEARRGELCSRRNASARAAGGGQARNRHRLCSAAASSRVFGGEKKRNEILPDGDCCSRGSACSTKTDFRDRIDG